ncbi:alpha/beta hydrolase family protein [Kitasatospora sp. NPDC101183]|uniref:alpha/beta hydrolase family protein n=1 Tax=Kitasatospora sp. NPDC101183 TaxID=3364100 RepID=UPI0037F5156D
MSLHLVDPSRRDTWVPSQPVRELMVQLWYPAKPSPAHPHVPYMTPGAAAAFMTANHLPADRITLPPTHSTQNAPAEPGRHPILLYAHGSHDNRAGNTALLEDLASHGYTVVSIDHTHYAEETELPDGRVATEVHDPDPGHELDTRVADTHFVLDQITALAHGANPDAEHRALPPALAATLDPARTGMFGASFGGVESAAAMNTDPRITAAANLDGPLSEPAFGPISHTGVTKPLLNLTSAAADSHPPLRPLLHGWGRVYRMDGSQHLTYSDGETLTPQAQPVLHIPTDQLTQQYGTIAPPRALYLTRTYLRAFFDQQLRNRHTCPDPFNDPSTTYPEMKPGP